MSIAAYKRTIRETESPRQIERRILTEVTNRLERHVAAFDATRDPGERLALLSDGLRQAVWENEGVWITLKADLAVPENRLPPALKAQLISLALWVERHSQAVLGGKGQLAPLVEINRAIIAGLAGQAPAPQAV